MRGVQMRAGLIGAGVAALIAIGASRADAATLTFDFSSPALMETYSEDGFDMKTDIGGPQALATWAGFGSFDADTSPGSATLLANNGSGSTLFFSAAGGVPFSFESIDLADTFNDGTSFDVNFLFTFAHAPGMSASVTLDRAVGLQTVVFGLADVILVQWSSTGLAAQFDNIQATAAVATTPLPAALPLFASALGGFGLIGWRRKKQQSRRDA
jgi:hypothetical protein